MINVLFSCQICLFICMYVCTKSFLKTTTNSSCVCTHLANKADSDSDSDSEISIWSLISKTHPTKDLTAIHVRLLQKLQRKRQMNKQKE